MCALVTGVQTCALPISGSRDRSLVGSEGADDREEARQPALAAGAGDVALANVADARVGDACRGDAVVGADVDRADKARDLHPFVAAIEGEQLFAAHQHRAVRIDLGDRHADLARKLVRLRRIALRSAETTYELQ